MIVLKISNISELMHSFRSANGSPGVIPYPLFNQIKAKLEKKSIKNEHPYESTYYYNIKKLHYISSLAKTIFASSHTYLVFSKTHLNNTLRIFCRVKRVSIICLPPIKIWRILSMFVIGGNLGQKLLAHHV